MQSLSAPNAVVHALERQAVEINNPQQPGEMGMLLGDLYNRHQPAAVNSAIEKRQHRGGPPLSATWHIFSARFYLRLEAVGLAADHTMELPLTQVELADVLGISAVHANRVLQELRERSVVTWEHKRVEITDWAGLAHLAQFDEEFLFREKCKR